MPRGARCEVLGFHGVPRFFTILVRAVIPTRLAQVTSPKWEVAKVGRDGSRPSSGYSAEFIDASVLIKSHIFSLEWIMTNIVGHGQCWIRIVLHDYLKLPCQRWVDLSRRIALEEVHTFSIIWTCCIGLLRSEVRFVPMCWDKVSGASMSYVRGSDDHLWTCTNPLSKWSRFFVSLLP